MELLYYIDMTEEYYADAKLGQRVDKNLYEKFLFKLGQVTGELGIGPVKLEIFEETATHHNRIFLSFQKPEDAVAFKLKWV